MLVTKSPGGTQYWWLHGGAAVSIGSHLEHSREFCKCVAAADARKSSCVYGGILHFLRSVLNDIFRKGRRERMCTTSHEGTACAVFCIYVQHLCRWIYQLLSAAIWNWKQFTHDRNLFWDEESEQSLQAKSRGSSMPLILTYMDTLLGLQPVAHTGWAQLRSPPLLFPSVHWMLISFVILPKQNLEGFWNTLGTNLKVCSLKESTKTNKWTNKNKKHSKFVFGKCPTKDRNPQNKVHNPTFAPYAPSLLLFFHSSRPGVEQQSSISRFSVVQLCASGYETTGTATFFISCLLFLKYQSRCCREL